MKESGQGGRWAAGLAGQHVGSLARRRQPHHNAAPGAQPSDASAEHRRLAGARGADDEHQPVRTRYRPGRGGLRVLRCGRRNYANRLTRPAQQRGFLVEDGPGGQAPVGDVLADGSAVEPAGHGSAGGWVQSEAPSGRLRGELVDQLDQLLAGAGGIGWQEGGDLPGHVGLQPRRTLLAHSRDRLGDHRVPIDATEPREPALGRRQ